MSDCVFCKIRDGQIPAKLVMRDDRCVAFDDINPQAPVHVLFVPLQHIPSTNALTPEDRELVGHLVLAATRVAAERGIAESGYRLLLNSGRDAGQAVFHLHLHLIGGRQLRGSMG
jgi:histidine triad (HIT) family protein